MLTTMPPHAHINENNKKDTQDDEGKQDGSVSMGTCHTNLVT